MTLLCFNDKECMNIQAFLMPTELRRHIAVTVTGDKFCQKIVYQRFYQRQLKIMTC